MFFNDNEESSKNADTFKARGKGYILGTPATGPAHTQGCF